MRSHLKISLWSLALAATTTGAVLAMHTHATPPGPGSTGSLTAVTVSTGIRTPACPGLMPRSSATRATNPSSHTTSQENTMDMLLGAFAFAAFVLGQVAAVIVVYSEAQRRAAEASRESAASVRHLDHRAKLIWNAGS